MKDLVDLSIGNVKRAFPKEVFEEAYRSIEESCGYGPQFGLEELREHVAKDVSEFTGISTSSGQVVLTTGASMALTSFLAAEMPRSSSILLPTPCFPGIENTVKALGLKAARYTKGYLYNTDTAVDAVLVNSPHNPTGSVKTNADLQTLLTFGKHTSIPVISDEAYIAFALEKPVPPLLGEGNPIYRIRSFSKHFGLAGMRLGAIIAPNSDAAKRVARTHYAMAMSAPVLPQMIANALFSWQGRSEWMAEIIDQIRRNLQRFGEGILELGFPWSPPDAGIFAWVDVSMMGIQAPILTQLMLRQSAVLVSDSSMFLDFDGAFIRVNMTVKPEYIERALDALRLAKLVIQNAQDSNQKRVLT